MPINIDLQHLRTLFSKMEAYSPFFGVSSPYRWPLRSVFILTALTCGVLFAAGRAGQLTGFVAYVSALAFGGALLVSMSTVFIKRYAIPLDPLIIIVVCLGIWRTMTGLLRWGVGCAVPSKRLARADAAPRFGE